MAKSKRPKKAQLVIKEVVKNVKVVLPGRHIQHTSIIRDDEGKRTVVQVGTGLGYLRIASTFIKKVYSQTVKRINSWENRLAAAREDDIKKGKRDRFTTTFVGKFKPISKIIAVPKDPNKPKGETIPQTVYRKPSESNYAQEVNERNRNKRAKK